MTADTAGGPETGYALCFGSDPGRIIIEQAPRGWHIRVAGVGVFDLDARDGAVKPGPLPGVSAAAVDYVLQHHIAPLQRSARGELVVHCSAVAGARGALLLVTETGCGKSTLAAFLARNGFALMADDHVVLSMAVHGVSVSPTAREVRLWDDSLDALGARDQGHQPGGEYTRKFAVDTLSGARFCDSAQPLAAILVLGDGVAREPQLQRCPGSEALYQVLPHLFHLPSTDHAARFRDLASALDGVPVYELDYPTRYDVLPDVAALLREL